MVEKKNPNRALMWELFHLRDGLESFRLYDDRHTGPKSWEVQPEHTLISKFDADSIIRFAELLKSNPELIVEDLPGAYAQIITELGE